MNKRVLVVDDSIFMRMILKKVLITNKFEVVGEASNGVEAVDKYRQLNPDIVTMDITMPNMNGIEALKEILRTDSKAKIVMVSALGQETFIRESISFGAKGFIVKPFNEDYVVNTLGNL